MRERRASAAQILSRFDIITPPVPIEEIVQRLEIRLSYPEDPGWSGAVKITPPGLADIWVASNDGPHRRRFTLAHELAHLMLHNPVESAYRDISFSGTREEVEANQYAAALLMPLWLLQQAVDAHGVSIRFLARMFDVSNAAMHVRLDKLMGM